MTYLTIEIFVTITALILGFFIVIKITERKNWARWLLFISYGFSLLICCFAILYIFSIDPIDGINILAPLLITTLAVALLVQKPARDWFQPKSAITQEEIALVESKQDSKGGVQGKYYSNGKLRVSVDVLVQLLLQPRILAAYALSGFIGILLTFIINFVILGSDGPSIDFGISMLCFSLGALICIFSSLFFMVIYLTTYRITNQSSKTIEKHAGLGVLIGIIPGCVLTFVFTIISWGIIVV